MLDRDSCSGVAEETRGRGDGLTSDQMRTQVMKAREVQRKRFSISNLQLPIFNLKKFSNQRLAIENQIK